MCVTRSVRWQVLGMGLLLAMVLAGPALAKEEVPLKARGTGYATITALGPPVAFNIDGSGQATHLGRYTVEGRDGVVYPDGTWEGTYVWTAANGDTITTHAEGYLTAEPAPYGGWEATYKILDGTGRFAGASGEFDQTGVWLDPVIAAQRRFAVVWEGTISSPGSHK